MKRIMLAGAAGLWFCLTAAHGAWALSWKDVASLHQDGVADSLIIQKIVYSGQRFELEAGDIRDLKKAGVPDEVISVMLRTEGRIEDGDTERGDSGNVDRESDNYRGSDYQGGDTYSHVHVGLGLGYYAPYYGSYYGGYYAPYCGSYAPYYYGGYYAPYYYPPRYRGYYGYAGSGYGYSRPRYNYYGQSNGKTRTRHNYYGAGYATKTHSRPYSAGYGKTRAGYSHSGSSLGSTRARYNHGPGRGQLSQRSPAARHR